MNKTRLTELMEKYLILECELESAIEFVNELLYARKKELEKNEPTATNTIARLETAEHEVWDLLEYIDEIEEEEA